MVESALPPTTKKAKLAQALRRNMTRRKSVARHADAERSAATSCALRPATHHPDAATAAVARPTAEESA